MLYAVRIIRKHAYCVAKCKLLNFSVDSVQVKLGLIWLTLRLLMSYIWSS